MIFNYEHGMAVHLGVGWDPQNTDSNKIIGGYLIPQDTSEIKPSATDSFSQKFSNSFSEFQNNSYISLDVSGKGTIGVFKASGKASYSREREIFRNKRNIIWTISGQRKYEAVSASGIDLTDSGESFINEISETLDYNKLRKKMGSHLVTSITKTSEIHLVYIFTVSDSRIIDTVKAAISAHVSTPTAGGAVNSSFMESIRNVDKSVQLEVQVKHSGIDDNSTSIAEIISAAPGDLSQVRKLMSQAIQGIAWSKARILEFSAEPMSSIYDVPDTSFDIDLLYSRTSRLKRVQEEIIRRFLELDDLLIRNTSYGLELKGGAVEDINSEMDDLNNAFDSVDKTVKEIEKTPDSFSNFPHITIPTGKLHWINLDFGKFVEWEYEVSGNMYNSHSERILGTATYWSVFQIKNPDMISRLEVVRDGTSVFSIGQSQLIRSVDDQIFDSKPYYSTSHMINEYCHRGVWGEVCNPWAADKRKIANQLKGREKSFSYILRIIDIENNSHEYPFINVASQQL